MKPGPLGRCPRGHDVGSGRAAGFRSVARAAPRPLGSFAALPVVSLATILAVSLAVGSAAAAAGAAAGRPDGAPRSSPGAVPVLLVPGWMDTGRDLAGLRSRLVGAGWAAGAVETVTFSDPAGSNRTHARDIARAVARVRERTGAPIVDVVAYSMGGLATRLYLREAARNGRPPVRRVVFVASPHRGTIAAYLAWGDGAEEMEPESPFLESLNAGPALPAGIDALTIRTVLDTHILPWESATLPGVPDRQVCCPSHARLVDDADVFRIVRRFLEEGDPGSSSSAGSGWLHPLGRRTGGGPEP